MRTKLLSYLFVNIIITMISIHLYAQCLSLKMVGRMYIADSTQSDSFRTKELGTKLFLTCYKTSTEYYLDSAGDTITYKIVSNGLKGSVVGSEYTGAGLMTRIFSTYILNKSDTIKISEQFIPVYQKREITYSKDSVISLFYNLKGTCFPFQKFVLNRSDINRIIEYEIEEDGTRSIFNVKLVGTENELPGLLNHEMIINGKPPHHEINILDDSGRISKRYLGFDGKWFSKSEIIYFLHGRKIESNEYLLNNENSKVSTEIHFYNTNHELVEKIVKDFKHNEETIQKFSNGNMIYEEIKSDNKILSKLIWN